MSAQTTFVSERKDLGSLGGDIWSSVTSPVHVDHRDVVPLVGALATIGLVSLADSAAYGWLRSHQQTAFVRLVRPFRDTTPFALNQLGSGQWVLPLSVIAYTIGRIEHNTDWRDAGMGCAAAHLSSAALREVIYLSVSRARPAVDSGPHHISFPGRKDWNWHSFLSGHSANSMGCISFLDHRFDLGAARYVVYAYPAAIGLGRMSDGEHWASDTMAGELLGYAIGKNVSDRQFARRRPSSASSFVSGMTLNVPLLDVIF